jgi:hypothetical protein
MVEVMDSIPCRTIDTIVDGFDETRPFGCAGVSHRPSQRAWFSGPGDSRFDVIGGADVVVAGLVRRVPKDLERATRDQM